MFTKFTNSQKLACDISRNIAVTAGAGSGKTSVLAERYLWCLENNGYQVPRVVAITFTEKAAGEMLGRIRGRILDMMAKDLGESSRWEEVLEKLPLAHISTIHGFCQRLLREFPIEAGIDPNFDVYDEALKRIRLMRMLDEFIQERADSHDRHIRRLSDVWTSPLTIRNILLHLIDIRSQSLPWAEQIRQADFPEYLKQIQALVADVQQRGLRRLKSDPLWQTHIDSIRGIIPPGDTSKNTSRCLNILEYEQEFRQSADPEQQTLILQMLKKDCRMVTPNKQWKEDNRNGQLKEIFSQLKTLIDRSLPDYVIKEGVEESGFQLQQALAELLLEAHDLYRQDKAARQMLDFDDLQEYALRLLEHPDVHDVLARRYDYLMVDEFQDTDQLQWSIIRQLGMTTSGYAPNRFCVVGDEKQSIYMFRGADVSVFSEVRQTLQQINADHQLTTVKPHIPERGDPAQWQAGELSGELIMAENFRSDQPLIAVFNYLFVRLFLAEFDPERPYEVRHQELLPGRNDREHTESEMEHAPTSDACAPLEFLLVNSAEADADSETDTDEEPELIARRILELVQIPPDAEHADEKSSQRRYKDIAILLRARTRLKDFEDALRLHHIPFIVAGGIGFFQQQEIYDMANLLRVLVDTRQDIALTGLLRSPFFHFSDDQLLYIAAGTRAETLAAPKNTPKMTLWDLLRHHALSVEQGANMIPEELEPRQFAYAFNTLNRWKAQADRIPITHLLRQVLDDTGLYGILAADRRNTQAISNVEKFLDRVRTFEREGFQSLSDFVAYLDQLIDIEEREGEAQIHAEGMDVVRLMTIHAAKGLEFPVVFVPEINRSFNYGAGESIYIDTLRPRDTGSIAAGIKGLNPEENFETEDTVFRQYLKHLNQEKTDAEMKRLLYVACTRAETQLILSGKLSPKIPVNSWLGWLFGIFPLQDSLEEGQFTMTVESAKNEREQTFVIPVRTTIDVPADEESNSGFAEARKPQTGTVSPEGQDENCHSGTPETDEIRRIVQENLRPLKGDENKVFTISPSSVHLLFQCPRRYYHQHVRQLEENWMQRLFQQEQESPEPETPSSFGTLRGTIIHKIFEDRIFDADWTEAERFAAINEFADVKKLSPTKRQAMNLDDAIRSAYRHYGETGLRELVTQAAEVHREHQFHYKRGQAEITGILDALFLDPTDHVWTILDYKSNEIGEAEIEEEIQRHGYDLQMQLYGLAISRLLQTDRVKSILFFTCPGVRYEAVDMSPTALHNLDVKLAASLRKLSQNIIETCQNEEVCQRCEYRLNGLCLQKT